METLIYSLLAISMLISPGVTEYTIPETIDVRITNQQECYKGIPYHVETLDFKEYVKGVLAAEWGNNWHEESLKAGAVATKMYAWSIIEAGGRYHDADVYDCTFDQVYTPSWRTEATDKAVDDTWDQALVSENPGNLIRTYYNAWYGGCIEREAEGQCMGQWNSKNRADRGMLYEDILYVYYDNSILVTANSVADITADITAVPEAQIEEEVDQTPLAYYTIQPGDSLSLIAKEFYGSSTSEYYMVIYEANADVLQSPDMINVGVVIVLP